MQGHFVACPQNVRKDILFLVGRAMNGQSKNVVHFTLSYRLHTYQAVTITSSRLTRGALMGR